MKNKWGRSLLAGLLCFAMMLTVVCVEPTYTHASVKEAESDTAPVTLTNATFKVLKRGESLPIYEDLLVWRDWTTVGTGKVLTTTEAVENNEDLAGSYVAEVPEAAQDLLEEGEEIRWFTIRNYGNKNWNDWRVYGKICKIGEKTDEDIDASAITDYSNCYFTRFYILQDGQKAPTSLDDIDQLKWDYVQTGYSTKQRRIMGYENVEPLLAKAPSFIKLEEDEELHWIAMTASTNQCRVYGVISKIEEEEEEPLVLTKATFRLLNRGQSMPIYSDLFTWQNWTTVGTGTISTTKEFENDEVFVGSHVIEAPEAAQDYLEAGEEIRWYATKNWGNANYANMFVYGKICKIGEETDEYIDASTITDYSNCYFTRYYLLQYGQKEPTSLEEIDSLKWNTAPTGYATKQRRIMGYENVEPLLAKAPTNLGLEEDEAVHWIAMTASTNQCRVYGVIYNVNVEKSREEGAVDSDETEVTVDTFADAKALHAIYKDGTIIKTRGYYKAGDGGAAIYVVSNHGNGRTFSTFTTAAGQHVNLVVENDRIDLRQLGAGVCEEIIYNTSDIEYNDDAARLSEAIALIDAYDGGEVYIPEGNYRCASKVSMGGDHYSIIGDGNTSILYTDNGYKGDEHFLTIVGNDITLDSIRVEAHETKWVPYYRQCSLLAASDINILNCEFSVKDNVISYDGNTDRQYTNITLYTGWHNVTIDNCLMEQTGCVERGACLGIIDMWSNGCSNVSVTNCVMRQNAHDEMLGIFTKQGGDASIENIYIANNKMYTASAPNVSRKTMAITIGYNDSKGISNVRFVDNEVVADLPSNFMTFGALSDCVIENNKFTINRSVSYTSGVVFDASTGVTVKNNDVTITTPKGGGVTHIFKNDGLFENNTIECDGYVYSVMYCGGKAIGNDIHITGGCHSLAMDPEQISDNTITVEGYMDNFIHYTKLLSDSTITNNTFNYLFDDTEADYHPSIAGNVLYAGFHAGIDGHTVTFSDNTIHAPNVTSKNKCILLYGVGGSDEQTFIIKNNKVGVYKWVRNLYGQSLGGVQTENNVDSDGNVVDYTDNITYFYNEVK